MDRLPPILVVILLWTVTAKAEYLFTMPRSMEAGTKTQYCITLKGFTSSEDVQFIMRTITIINPETNLTAGQQGLASGKRGDDSDWSKCDELTVPDETGTFRVKARVSVDDDDIIEETTDVRIKKPDLITLIQTDKPIYKPGQTVKFRAMTMDYQLNAKTSGFPKISILAPNGMKMTEWTDVPAPNGLVSLEMPLSSDPVLGEWKITANDGHKDTTEPFKVDKYVLPKFEVTVTPPSYLLPTTPKISGTVCAKYTYGEAVKGTLKMEICYKAKWQSSYYEARPCDHILEKIDGCFDFYIDSDNIRLGRRGHTMWGNLLINASVTEEATGIELHGNSEGPSLSQYPLQLKMEDDSNNYFKPGLPFRGRVIVTNPDGTPAPGEYISVSATNYNSRYDWKKNFTSDENGVVHYVLTDISPENGNLNIRSEAVVYRNDWRYTDDELYFKTYAPTSYSYLTQWYSASNSYVYIKDIDDKVDCDSTLFLDVFYNTVPETAYVFNGIVKAGDRVIHTVQQTHRFDGTVADLDLLSIDPDQILQKIRKNLPEDCLAGQYFHWSHGECEPCPLGQYQDAPGMTYCNLCAANSTSADDRLSCVPHPLVPVEEEEIVPVIVEEVPFDIPTPAKRKRRQSEEQKLLTHFTMEVPVTKDMAPNAKILVYYIRDDFEVVATSIKFDIRSCFKNQVKMEFTPTTVRPGEDINLHLESAPESTCFVGMVDKSINLLGGSNQLTPAQVFENVQRVARPWSWVSYWQEDRDYCDSKKPPPDPESPPDDDFYAPWSYSYSRPEGADSVFAFRDVEMWVITDATLETRPCKDYRPPVFYDDYDEGPVSLVGDAGPPNLQVERNEYLKRPDPKKPATSLSVEKKDPERIRSLFPETWLWDIVSLGEIAGPEGAVDVLDAGVEPKMDEFDETSLSEEPQEPGRIRSLFPETWLWDIVTIGDRGNIHISGPPSRQLACCTHGRSHIRSPVLRSGFGSGVRPTVSTTLTTTTTVAASVRDTKSKAEPRSFFPETWLWNVISIGNDGILDMTTPIPDTITNWVGNSLCTHPEAGIGVTEITEVTAFQPFFLSFTLPYSAVRGETVPVLVTVFNYLSDCIAMEVRLSEGEGFELSFSASSRQFCLCGGLSESTKFNIVPTVVGEIDIEATAVSIPNNDICKDVVLSQETVGVSDGVQRQLPIEAEGVPQEVTESIYLCTDDYKPDTKLSIDMTLPEDLVPDSERATVSVIGDILGPTLSNLKDLLRMPYGCGEQNMASWSPNIYVLMYLTNTNQLTEKTEEEAKGYMRVGYQRQMNYRHRDNSYSAFGDNSYGNATGSLWLTAFVVKSMAQSFPYITIDREDVQRSVDWLISKQIVGGDKAGCFPKVGKVFSSYMKGGLRDGENTAGLTAFVLIALLEANIDVMHPAIHLGFQCLDRQSTLDTYTLAIATYAYTLYDPSHPVRERMMDELNRRKISSSGLEYWKREESEFSEESSTRYWYRAPSAEVEITAYVMMSILTGGGQDALNKAQPIVQWLTRQRNSYGGFSSTQDTVVALQALARYASLTYSGETNLQLEVKGPGIDHVFTVTPNNSLLYQSQSARAGQGDISFSISGKGCAMMQVAMKYNIFKLEEEGPAFDVKVSVFRSRAFRSKCDRRTIEVCTSYRKSGGVSNMAIAEVKMPTGWEPVVETLETLVEAERIAKYESDEGFVELYFDEIGRQRQCVEFDVSQEIVMNPKPARVKVYDYYETTYSVVTLYEIKTFCGTKEELPFPKPGDPIDDMMQRRLETSPRVGRLQCPMCPSETPTGKDLTDLICESEAVYKAIVGRPKRYPAKVKSNLRSKKKVLVDMFVNYNMADDCECSVLSMKEQRALIFTASTNLNTADEILTLDGDTTILPISKQLEFRVRELSKLSKRCEKLKRRRRSKEKKELRRRNRNRNSRRSG